MNLLGPSGILVWRRLLGQGLQCVLDVSPLTGQVAVDSVSEDVVGKVVGGVGKGGQITPLDLMLPLSPCLYPRQLQINRGFDSLSIQKRDSVSVANGLRKERKVEL